MTVHSVPRGKIRLSDLYLRILEAEDQTSTDDLIYQALSTGRIQAQYTDKLGNSRNLSPAFWDQLWHKCLRYLTDHQNLAAWVDLMETSFVPVENPTDGSVSDALVFIGEDALKAVLSKGHGTSPTAKNVGGKVRSSNPGGTPKVHDSAAFGAIVAHLHFVQGEGAFGHPAELRRKAMDLYQQLLPDNDTLADSWAKPIVSRLMQILRSLDSMDP